MVDVRWKTSVSQVCHRCVVCSLWQVPANGVLFDVGCSTSYPTSAFTAKAAETRSSNHTAAPCVCKAAICCCRSPADPHSAQESCNTNRQLTASTGKQKTSLSPRDQVCNSVVLKRLRASDRRHSICNDVTRSLSKRRPSNVSPLSVDHMTDETAHDGQPTLRIFIELLKTVAYRTPLASAIVYATSLTRISSKECLRYLILSTIFERLFSFALHIFYIVKAFDDEQSNREVRSYIMSTKCSNGTIVRLKLICPFHQLLLHIFVVQFLWSLH